MNLFNFITTLLIIIFVGGNIFFVFALIMNGENFVDDDDAQEAYIRQYVEQKRQKKEAKELKKEQRKQRKDMHHGNSV